MKINRHIAVVVRVIFASVFVFSGFVKAVDPWGTAIKIGEYLAAFGLEWFDWVKFPASIALSGAELMLGMALLFSVRTRAMSLLAMIFMICVTPLTLYIALTDPVSDCGCFGDAVKLSNWETFFKNLVLLPMSILIRRSACPVSASRRGRETAAVAVLAALSLSVGIYCYRHLPLIDFLPFKEGTDLLAEATDDDTAYEPQVVYMDKTTGERRIFALTDTTWYDSDRWEWVETLDAEAAPGIEASTDDLRIYDARTDITERFVNREVKSAVIVAQQLDDIDSRCRHEVARAAARAASAGYEVLCLTATPVPEAFVLDVDGQRLPCYNADGTMLKTLLRAHVGMVIVNKGVIECKANCRDMIRKGDKID